MTCWVGSSYFSYHPTNFVGLVPCESKDKIFFICHVTTSLMFQVILWVGSLHPKSPSC